MPRHRPRRRRHPIDRAPDPTRLAALQAKADAFDRAFLETLVHRYGAMRGLSPAACARLVEAAWARRNGIPPETPEAQAALDAFDRFTDALYAAVTQGSPEPGLDQGTPVVSPLLHELPIDDLWQFVLRLYGTDTRLWGVWRADMNTLLELQKRMRAHGKIPAASSAWRPIEPGEPGFDPTQPTRRRLREGETIWVIAEIGPPWKDVPPEQREGRMERDIRQLYAQRDDIIQVVAQRTFKWDDDDNLIGDDRKIFVELPATGREPEPERPPPGRPGRPKTLPDEVLRQSLDTHPDLTNRERTAMLNKDLGLPDPKDPKSRALHPKTVASRVREELKLRQSNRWPEGLRQVVCLLCSRPFPSESKAQRLCPDCR